MGETVAVCRKCERHKCLTAFLIDQAGATVRIVGCQKVCKGPVAGVRVGGRMEWFGHLDKAKAMVALARLATRPEPAKLPKALQKRRVAKHSGRPVR